MPTAQETQAPAETEKKKGGFGFKALVAVVGSTLTALILLKTPLWGTGCFLSFAAAWMGFEMSVAIGQVKNRFAAVVAVVGAAAVPWAFYFQLSLPVFAACLCGLLLLLFASAVFFRQGPPAKEILACVLAVTVFPSVTSLLLELLRRDNGTKLVVVPIIIAWSADGMAQIVGMLCGKHKMFQHISPKKTAEGFLGGIVGGIVGMGIYALILHLRGVDVHLGAFLLLAFIGALLGELGDLSLSLVKRAYGIKDFGHMLPYHGGVLDRFDSILFVLPFCWIVTQWIDLF